MTSGAEASEQQADKRASRMEALMTEHESALLRYAARLVNSSSAAQDVVQNVFIKCFRGGYMDSVAPGAMKSWLFRVTHNEAVDHVRREARLTVLHEEHGEESCHNPAGSDPGDTASQDERREMVFRALARLNPREKQVVLLRLQEGLSYREIADVTRRTTGNVGNILHHAVKKLAKRLKKEVGAANVSGMTRTQ